MPEKITRRIVKVPANTNPRRTPDDMLRVCFRRFKRTDELIGVLFEEIGSESDPMPCLAYTFKDGFIVVNPYLLKVVTCPVSIKEKDSVAMMDELRSKGFNPYRVLLDRNEFQVTRILKVQEIQKKKALGIDGVKTQELNG